MNDSLKNIPSMNNLTEFKPWLTDLLHKGTVSVSFTKVNGEFRKMDCTLAESAIPVAMQPKPLAEGVTPRKVSEESLRVFDTNKQEWRAFRWDKIQGISYTNQDGTVETVE